MEPQDLVLMIGELYVERRMLEDQLENERAQKKLLADELAIHKEGGGDGTDIHTD